MPTLGYQSTLGIRHTVARLRDVSVVLPAYKALTETSSTLQLNTAGIVAPDNAPSPSLGAATGPTGTYSYYATFYDSTRDAEGNPSAASGSVSPANQKVTVDLTTITNESANSRVDKIRIYRNANGGTTFYRIAEVAKATASYTDDDVDADITSNDTLELDNAFLPTADNFHIVIRHKERLFAMNEAGKIAWCKAGRPDNWPTVDQVYVSRQDGWDGTALSSMGDMVVIYKEKGIHQLGYDLDPNGVTGDGWSKQRVKHRGAINHRCVVNVDDVHYVMDADGIYVYRGGEEVADISERIRPLLERRNMTVRKLFCGVASEDRIRFFVALDGETECKYAFVLDLKSLRSGAGVRWWLDKYDFAIRDACRYTLGDKDAGSGTYNQQGKTITCAIDNAGYVWVLDVGLSDGQRNNLTVQGTTTAATTSTITDSTATFTSGSPSYNPNGAYLRLLDSNGVLKGPYRITSATATVLKIASTFETTVANGTTYLVGHIDAFYETPQMAMGNAFARKMLDGFEVQFTPRGTAFTIGMSVLRDREAALTQAATVTETNYATISGEALTRVNMGAAAGRTGFVELTAGRKAFTYGKLRVSALGVRSPVEITGFDARARLYETDR